MAYTLAEAAKLSNDVLRTGVLESIVSESPVLRVLPFVEVLGNGLTYNRENALPTAAYFGVGDTWTESTPTFSQITAALKIFGGDADIDNFIAKTRSNLQDLTATTIELKAKAVAYTFEDGFIYGSVSISPNQFDGLHALCPVSQRVSVGSGAIPAALSLTKLDEAIDLVKPGKPHLILMSRRTQRLISQFARALSSPVNYQLDDFGKRVMTYNGIPVAVSDFMVDTETISSGIFSAKTGGASSSIFCLQFGEDGLHGIEANPGLTVDNIGDLETKDAKRYRVKWYAALVLLRSLAMSRVDGISSAAVVA